MEKQKEIDVSNNLASLFAELEKAKKEEKPKIVETKKEPDVSTISFLSELDNIAKETEKKIEVKVEKEQVSLLSQLEDLAIQTKEESYEIGKDYADHTKEITPGQEEEKPKKKKARKRKTVEQREPVDTVEHAGSTKKTKKKSKVSPLVELTSKQLEKLEQAEKLDDNSLTGLRARVDNLAKQMIKVAQSAGGGGGAVKLSELDDVDTSSQANGKVLKFSSSSNKYEFGTAASNVDLSAVDQDIIPDGNGTRNLGSASKRFNDLFLSGDTIDLAGATISSDGTGSIAIAATGAVLPAGSRAGDNELAVVSTTGSSQVARIVPFFKKSTGLDTINTNFEFNATIDDQLAYTATKSFTLANGSSLSGTTTTLFQF